jgi:hypothetical protein
MVEIIKNAAQWRNNTGAWVNPADACGAQNGVCAYKITSTVGTYDCELYDYGFAIPVGSTIDHVYIGFHSVSGSNVNADEVFGSFNLKKGNQTWTVSSPWFGGIPSCGYSQDRETLDIQPAGQFTPEDFNTPNFTTIIRAQINAYAVVRVDCVWIRVQYTPPVAVAPKMVGDGLTWVVACLSRRVLRKPCSSRLGLLRNCKR